MNRFSVATTSFLVLLQYAVHTFDYPIQDNTAFTSDSWCTKEGEQRNAKAYRRIMVMRYDKFTDAVMEMQASKVSLKEQFEESMKEDSLTFGKKKRKPEAVEDNRGTSKKCKTESKNDTVTQEVNKSREKTKSPKKKKSTKSN